MKIYQLYLCVFRYRFYSQLNLIMPVACAGLKPRMAVGNRSQTGNQNTTFRIRHSERINQCTIIRYKKNHGNWANHADLYHSLLNE